MIYAGFFRRALAFILDMFIVAFPTALVFGPMVMFQTLQLNAQPTEASAMQASLLGFTLLGWQVAAVVLTWLYFALMESSKYQATLGKMALGIKVVGKEGARISFARATGRFFAKALSYLILYIGFIMAGFTNRKRALHDLISETYVVKKAYQEGEELPATNSHPLLLLLVSLLWIAFLIGVSVLSLRANLTPTQAAARTAAGQMLQLAAGNTRLAEPLRLEGTSIFDTQEGYRAVVTDPASNNKFTLLLKNKTTEVCCQSFPFGDCAQTGLATCE